ncbi:hypothetical protein LTR53_015297 [Teratosphaeriaceae sp. CCFEE 6253]|nr:hypothetical protein LTR53_015297 [Teratosphaeriaceae sp. CCFEE 6253]
MRLDIILINLVSACHAVLPGDDGRIGRRALNAYAPTTAPCPTASIVRPATGPALGEAQYSAARKPVADAALASWLKTVNAGFNTSTLPTLGLAGSGGGYRALLNEAGIVQAMDARDSNSSVAGLYQALSYHAALSGGGWFASSLAAWNWLTVSYLQRKVYEPNLQQSLLLPGGWEVALAYARIFADVTAKAAAGYPVTPGDIYGRLIGWNLFPSPDGGAALPMSGLTAHTNFTAHKIPYPIITSIGTNASSGNCSVQPAATQYEYTPHKFGSWDTGVNSFVQTAYLGTDLGNGVTAHGNCTRGFDKLDFVTASTSNIFGFLCNPLYAGGDALEQLANTLQNALVEVAGVTTTELFNEIPNPFYGYKHANAVSGDKILTLGDGDLSLQNNPIWPFLQPARNVSVLLVADTRNENATNSPCDGLSLQNTFKQAQAQGLSKMPFVPTYSDFVARGLGSQARFFGCNQSNSITLIWLPLQNYSSSAAATTSTFAVQVSVADTRTIIHNGNLIATQNSDQQWPTCLACAVMGKTGTALPAGCGACFARYCVS